MSHPEPAVDGLKIAQVEKLTGVGVHTLRAWERRYGVPRPARSEGKQRLYSVQDVELVRRMAALAESGVSLQRAARTALQELETRPGGGATNPAGLLERFLDALLDYDERRAIILWNDVMESNDLLTALERMVVPALVQVGEAWHQGTAGVGQEHFATAFIRARLDGLSRQVTPMLDAPVVLLACLAGERHELGLLMLHVLLRFQGVATVYLGQDVPDAALMRSAQEVMPRVVGLHAGSTDAALRLPGIVSELTRVAPQAAVVFGGRAADETPALRSLAGGMYGGPGLRDALDVTVRAARRPLMGVR